MKAKSSYNRMFWTIATIVVVVVAAVTFGLTRDRDWGASGEAAKDLEAQSVCIVEAKVHKEDGVLVGEAKVCESRGHGWTPLDKSALPNGEVRWHLVCIDVNGIRVPLTNPKMNEMYAANGRLCPAGFDAKRLEQSN